MDTAFFCELPEADSRYPLSLKYVLAWIYNPDPGSKFDVSTKGVREKLAGDQDRLLVTLKDAGYDMFLGYESGVVYGHYGFQLHGGERDEMHVFSMSTAGEYRNKAQLLWGLTKSFIHEGRRKAGRIRLSEGNNEYSKSLLRALAIWQDKFGIRVDTDGCWIEYV